MKVNWLAVTKSLIVFIGSAGVGTVISNAVRTTLPANSSTITKTLTNIGGFVLSGMVANSAAEYLTSEFDSIFKENEPDNK